MDIYEFKLLLKLSNFHKEKLIGNAIQALQNLSGPEFLLLGEDSGLVSVWEEICVQVQQEQSPYWDAFQDTIENVLDDEFDKQHDAVKELLIYIDGADEDDDENANSKTNALMILKSDLIDKAGWYENENILNYLDGGFEDEDEDEDEDEEEDESEDDGDDKN